MANAKTKDVKKKSYNVMGQLELLFLLSVSYLVVVVAMGTDTIEPKLLAVPAIIGVAVRLVKRFN